MEAGIQMATAALEILALGGGCFWCLEGAFARLKGVQMVECGYSNGQTPPISYEQVCTGQTGCVEVVRLQYDPKQISTQALLQVFFALHDPTTLNQQGADRGPQYRSIVLYDNNEQKNEAETAKRTYQKDFKNPIVTEIVPLRKFYPAETYHQNYYKANSNKNPYCSAVIAPKVAKLRHLFGDLLKK